MFWIFLRFYGYISCTFMYMLKRYVDVDDIWIYIYMVQFLESSKEGLLKNRRPSNNRISLKNRTFFFCRPGMSLKKYSFLRTSCPELFKENSQEDENVTSQLVLAEHFDVSARMSQLISTIFYIFVPFSSMFMFYAILYAWHRSRARSPSRARRPARTGSWRWPTAPPRIRGSAAGQGHESPKHRRLAKPEQNLRITDQITRDHVISCDLMSLVSHPMAVGLETPWSSKPPEILLWRHQIQTTNTDCLKEAPAQISIRLGSRLLAWRTLKGQSWMQSLPASLEHSWRILTIQVCFRWVCATSFTFISESEKGKKIEKLTATIERWWKMERNEKARSLHGRTVPLVIMCEVQSVLRAPLWQPRPVMYLSGSGSLRMEPRSLQVVKE